MSGKDTTKWLLLGGAAVGIYYYLKSSGMITVTTATPYSIYPEFAYTAQTSMAASPGQKAPAAVITPMPYFAAVQAQEQAAILTQCAGSYPGCTVLTADTQLGF